MKATRNTAVPTGKYQEVWGKDAYDDPQTESVTCPDCNRVVKVSVDRHTMPEHTIPGTPFRCDASAGQFKRQGGRIVLKYEAVTM